MNKINPNEFTIPQEFSIYYVGAEWCAPCRRLKPQINEFLEGKDFPMFEINADEIDRENSYFKLVKSVPTILVFENGQELLRKPGPSIQLIKTLIENKKIGEKSYWEKYLEEWSQKPATHYYLVQQQVNKDIPQTQAMVVDFIKVEFDPSIFIYQTAKIGESSANEDLGKEYYSKFCFCELGQFFEDRNYYLDIANKRIISEEQLPPTLKSYADAEQV